MGFEQGLGIRSFAHSDLALLLKIAHFKERIALVAKKE